MNEGVTSLCNNMNNMFAYLLSGYAPVISYYRGDTAHTITREGGRYLGCPIQVSKDKIKVNLRIQFLVP
jgi:hypothetical protein